MSIVDSPRRGREAFDLPPRSPSITSESSQTSPAQLEQSWLDVDSTMKSFFTTWDNSPARPCLAHDAMQKTIKAINAQRTATEMRLEQMHVYTRMLEAELEVWSGRLDTAVNTLERLGPKGLKPSL
ncbi:hypothetical protein BJ138DRAFT_1103349 [Hygrophoropsis aurantiaca]|uniref:Uncharacterized protein n=1 Tax=Hygrophoropsis aurantiaca TaxID=72124 RepID=A0ACB8A6B2_9AGAM|nr:hypothetical protein BJ138DRAFT_1103349 [Hygrophoropsis aurantiaca]